MWTDTCRAAQQNSRPNCEFYQHILSIEANSTQDKETMSWSCWSSSEGTKTQVVVTPAALIAACFHLVSFTVCTEVMI